MTTSVDYTLTATLEGTDIASLLVNRLTQAGWQLSRQDDGLLAMYPPFTLNLELSQNDLVLVHGHFSLKTPLHEVLHLLLDPIHELSLNYGVDIYEEDGRLVKRIEG
jgi:hypothetical protein